MVEFSQSHQSPNTHTLPKNEQNVNKMVYYYTKMYLKYSSVNSDIKLYITKIISSSKH